MNLISLARLWKPADIVERLSAIPPLLGERAGVRADVTSSRRDIYFPFPSLGSGAQCVKNVSRRSFPEGAGRGEGEALKKTAVEVK